MKILDLEIKSYGYKEILKTIVSCSSTRKYFSFLNINAYIAVAARKDESLRNDLNQFSALYSDGIGIYFASKFLYGRSGLAERINGTDLYYKILDLAEKNNYGLFLFGGTENAAMNLEANLRELYPKLIIKGVIARKLCFDENILNEINSSNSDILFLGLGTPYQEKWIATFGKKTNIPIQIAAGSGIDFLSGVYKRAPEMLRKLGLEWLFRLFSEPKRLWKRYLLGIPHFVFLIIKQKLFTKESL